MLPTSGLALSWGGKLGQSGGTVAVVDQKPFRVLSLDGGGMRGIYTAEYLSCLASGFSKRTGKTDLDLGKGFNLIVGTSTGAIVGCALVAGVPLGKVVSLYKNNGKLIFPRRVPTGIGTALPDLVQRPAALRRGSKALQTALSAAFGTETVGEVFARRKIALAVTAVNLSNHRGWVFKTPHRVGKTNHRDDAYSLVDVCLASSAAPVYRSVAAIEAPARKGHYDTFIDGGLWANNPILVGLIDALEVAAPNQPIEFYSLGTCPRPAGTSITPKEVHRGLKEWKFGAEAAAIAIDAQEFTFDHMAKLLAPHLTHHCQVIRFPREAVPATMMKYLDLDETRNEAAEALIGLARADADLTNSRCTDPNDRDGALVNALFESMPEFKVQEEK
jgi:predicted acylesterase/phospholipase RssA